MSSGHFTATVTALADVVLIPCIGKERLAISFVVGAANLSDVDIGGKVADDQGYAVLATATGDFTTPVFPVIKASGDLGAAASGSTVHWIVIDCRGWHTIRLRAAGTASTVTGAWTAI